MIKLCYNVIISFNVQEVEEMKNTLKLLSVLLIVSMLFSTVAFAATFTDVSSDKNYYESVSVLSALGIINGYTDGTFGPEKNVTRAEFSAMLMRALASGGVGDPDPAGLPFVDLGGATWAVSDIRTAYDLGIINGMSETTFEPNSNVTYEQALKMVVCALNYGEHALQMQATMPAGMPWYSGYMQVAGDLGLVDGVNYVLGQPAKRWEIAQIIYNAFDVYLLKKIEMSTGEVMYQQTTDTILSSKLNVARAHGEIVADGTNTLAADGSVARNGYALVYETNTGKTLIYAKNGVSLDGLLGKSVEFFYKTDVYGERQLVYILSRGGDESSVKVDAFNIERVSGNNATGFTVSYYLSSESSATNTISLEPNAVISVNGVVVSNPTASNFWIENGTLEFIMNDGRYAKVNISSIETYVVKSVNKTDRYIVDMLRPSGSNTLYLDYEDGSKQINMVNSSGNEITINNLAANSVLSVKTGKGAAGRTSLDVEVSTKTASGVVEEVDIIGRKIEVAGKTYTISDYFVKNGSSVLNSISVRDSVKLYLDAYDKVAYAEKIANSSTFYGYIAAAGKDSNEEVKLAIISSKVKTVGSPYLTVASKVRINGVQCTDAQEILDELDDGALLSTANADGNGSTYSQLVKYTVNSSGLVTEIEFPKIVSDSKDIDENEFQAFVVTRDANDEMLYNSSNYEFTGANGSRFRINSSTEVFVVPSLDRADFVNYGKKTSSYFKNNGEYIVEPYDVDASLNIAKAVVVYQTKKTEPAISSGTGIYIITGIEQGDKDGVYKDFVKGYLVGNTGVVADKTEKGEYTDYEGTVSNNYDVGDVIIFAKNSAGYITNTSTTFKEALSISKFTPGVVTDGKALNTQRNLYTGLLYAAAQDGSNQGFEIALTDDVNSCETASKEYLTTNSNTKFFTYSVKNNKVEVLQQESLDLTSYASYKNTVDSGKAVATKIFAYKYYNKVIAVYVIQE